MSVKELERDKTGKAEPQKKIEPRKEWKAVLHYGASDRILCCACLLTKIFNMDSVKAIHHMNAAIATGKDIVFSSSRDVVETKVAQAEEEVSKRSRVCDPRMDLLKFTAEPG